MSSPNTSFNIPSPQSPYTSMSSEAAKDCRKRVAAANAPVYSPHETLNKMTKEAEQRAAEKNKVQKEYREIRAIEMEKKRREDEERDRLLSSSSTSSTPSRAGSIVQNTSMSMSSRAESMIPSTAKTPTTTTHHSKPPTPRGGPLIGHRSSVTSQDADFREASAALALDENNPKEMKKKLAAMEEKYKKHAIYQTQFENDNQKLLYEVDVLKDLIEEHEELIVELRRQFKDKSRELDYQKRSNKDLQTDFHRLKDILTQRDALIEESGLVLYTDQDQITTTEKGGGTGTVDENRKDGKKEEESRNGMGSEIKSVLPAALVAPETAKLLDTLGEGTIDDKLLQVLTDRRELKEHNARLQNEMDEEKARSANLQKKLAANANKLQSNAEASQDLHDIQRQYTKEINDLKMKLQKLDHENIIIKQDKQRLDTQLKYLQTNFDELEQTERRLIKEKREQQRELNESKNVICDLQVKLEVLQKTLEKKRQPNKFIAQAQAQQLAAAQQQQQSQSTGGTGLAAATQSLLPESSSCGGGSLSSSLTTPSVLSSMVHLSSQFAASSLASSSTNSLTSNSGNGTNDTNTTPSLNNSSLMPTSSLTSNLTTTTTTTTSASTTPMLTKKSVLPISSLATTTTTTTSSSTNSSAKASPSPTPSSSSSSSSVSNSSSTSTSPSISNPSSKAGSVNKECTDDGENENTEDNREDTATDRRKDHNRHHHHHSNLKTTTITPIKTTKTASVQKNNIVGNGSGGASEEDQTTTTATLAEHQQKTMNRYDF